MRSNRQSVGPVLRWPLTIGVIRVAVLVAAFNWPARSGPASSSDEGGAVSIGDTFLKVDGIEGESTDDQHRGELDIQSWSWGVSSTDTQVVGRPKFTDLTFATGTSRASPALMLACAQGKHLRRAILSVRKVGEERPELLKITLTDVMVTSFQQSGSGGAHPAEQFALDYAQMVMEYRLEKPDGSLGELIRGGWDVRRNRPL